MGLSQRRDRSLAGARKRERGISGEQYHAMYTSQWAEVSLGYRQENPLCRNCELRGILTPAQCVDHIIPHRGDYDLMWASDNWQSLCGSCHSNKTKLEMGGLVITWVQRNDRYVVFGKPGTGKTTFSETINADITWDMDKAAAAVGFILDHPTDRQLLLLQRQHIVERLYNNEQLSCVVIASYPKPAYAIGKRIQATMVHCWCSEYERQKRIKRRMGAVFVN